MEDYRVNFDLAIKEILIKWLEKLSYLDKDSKRLLFEFGCIYKKNMGFLYQIYNAIKLKEESLYDDRRNITYKLDGEKHMILYRDKKIVLTEEQLKEILVGMIDILEEILPLGSVVDLNKIDLKKFITDLEKVKEIRVVIMNRFLHQKGDSSYFTYAGVVYPVGIYKKQEILHFTSGLIESVVYRGYVDKQEEAYVYLRKNELIIEKGMHSFGFSTNRERIEYQERLLEGK